MTSKLWDSDKFWTAQDFQTSARLHLQHWIRNYQLGYALHPKLLTGTESSKLLRIADVAVGNGAWLLELPRTIPSKDAELVGFDITSANFMHSAWLPSNLKLEVWDAFSEVPQEYVGKFDIVHIRAIYSCIKANAVSPLLNNLLALLKPGGYLQWDEMDASTLSCQAPPGTELKAEAAETIVKIQNLFSLGQSQLLPDWLHNLPSTLSSSGCEVVAHEEFQPLNELARAWTDNMLLVWRDMIPMLPETAMPMPPGMDLPESISRNTFAELFGKAVDECSKGAMLGMVCHVFVARKGT